MDFEPVKKTRWVSDRKEGKWQRESPTTKNGHYREMLSARTKNRIGFRYVSNDAWWYASSENTRRVKEELEKEFMVPLESDRKVALSSEDEKRGDYEQVGASKLEPNTVLEAYLGQVPFALLSCKRVFTNEDGSEGGCSVSG